MWWRKLTEGDIEGALWTERPAHTRLVGGQGATDESKAE